MQPRISPPRPIGRPLRHRGRPHALLTATLALAAAALALAACDTAPAPPPAYGALCETPHAPLFDVAPAGADLVFTTSGGATVRVGTGPPGALAPDAWRDDDLVHLDAADAPYAVTVFAAVADPRCAGDALAPFAAVYTVAPAFAPGPGDPDTTAIAADDPRIVAWATAVVTARWGRDVDTLWRDPARCLGPAGDDALAATSLGNGGALTVGFARPIADAPGPDLAVFENAIDAGFLELARVEVSSDGHAFAAFDTAYLGDTPLGAFDRHDPRAINGLAGKYPLGYGTPFDLAHLRYHPAVQAGAVDLAAVRFVRVVDVIGDGAARDSFGHPIYDPTPTKGSGGFDLDAVAVLHEAP